MKVLQYAVCSFALTLAAAAQTAPTTQSPAPAAPKPLQLNTLGESAVKSPEHPLTLDQMKVLYTAMGYDQSIDQSVSSLIAMQKTRAAFIPTDFWDDIQASFKKIDYSTALLDVYKKYLSTEDAAKLIDFSKTEAGKHFLASLPEISREAPLAIQREQQQVAQTVQARHKDEIDAALKKYREEHQPKPAPTLGAPAPGSTAPSGAAAPSGSSPAPAPAPATNPQN